MILDIRNKVYITKQADHWFVNWPVKPSYGIVVDMDHYTEEIEDEYGDFEEVEIQNYYFDLFDNSGNQVQEGWHLQNGEYQLKPLTIREPEEWL